MALPPVATTTVGSFPRPGWLADHHRTEVAFRLEGALLREAQDDATIVALHEQERLGLDLLTDGEQRRPHFIYHVLSCLEGFDLVNRRPKAIRRRPTPTLVPRVVGRVRRRAPAVVEDLRFAKAHTTRPVKMAVPGPMTVVDSTYDEVYGDEAALAMDVAAALNEELLALQAAGCDVIQIDEPAMTRWQEKVAAYGAQALDRCLEGVTVPTIVHLCYGYPGTGTLQHHYEYPPLLARLMETRIGGFSVEFARSGYDPALLQGCGERLIMYGCVDPGPAPPEPVETIVARVQAALRYVDPARLLIAPDCGLMTISRDLARAKVQRLVEAARLVRQAL
ncbi:MAG TPA: 5-methyltetrahydropteroyltriglutamate--homocysteine methyltransferase [Chloroflexota bacterium]|nr:5-methyltetrahydropteroyltriglutamate--homocysteine methyltransferase [Chloroflexota bacterium]